jgi:hypothetical protein
MSDNDTMLIRELSGSYRLQRDCYTALGVMVDRILGRLVLSRGDLSGVKDEFAEKRRLLERIERERARTTGHSTEWQERKAKCAGRREAQELDAILRETEAAIRKFLEGETQLERYLERMAHTGK